MSIIRAELPLYRLRVLWIKFYLGEITLLRRLCEICAFCCVVKRVDTARPSSLFFELSMPLTSQFDCHANCGASSKSEASRTKLRVVNKLPVSRNIDYHVFDFKPRMLWSIPFFGPPRTCNAVKSVRPEGILKVKGLGQMERRREYLLSTKFRLALALGLGLPCEIPLQSCLSLKNQRQAWGHFTSFLGETGRLSLCREGM